MKPREELLKKYKSYKFNDNQMNEIEGGIRLGLSEEQISKYAKLEFDSDQMSQIRQGFQLGLEHNQVLLCADPKFNWEQMHEILLGFENGLSMEEVMLYAKQDFNSNQMEQIRLSFERGLTLSEVSILADPKFDWAQMSEIQKGLKNGLTIEQVSTSAKPEISWEKMKGILIARDKVYNIIHYAKSHNVEDTEEYIEYIFGSDEIYVNKESINQAYYQSFTKDIYIKGIENMYISIIKGAGDRYASLESHKGTDINLVFPFNNEWITIFNEDEYQGDKNLNKIDYLINSNSLTKDKVINFLKSYNSTLFIYNVLPDDMKNDTEIKQLLYDKLDAKAESIARSEKEYSDISPNGGLDVYVDKKQDILLKLFSDYNFEGNNKLIKYMEEKFCQDEKNQKYIKDEMLRNEKMLYFIENISKYNQQHRLILEQSDVDYKLNSTFEHKFDQLQYDETIEKINTYNDRIDDVTEKIKKTENKIQKNKMEIESINNKTYKIYEFYKRFEDNARSSDLKKTQSVLQTSLDFLWKKEYSYSETIAELISVKNTLEGYRQEEIDHKSYEERSKQIDKELEELHLKYNYDYLIKDNYREIYDYYDGYERSVGLLIGEFGNIKKEFSYFEHLNKVAEDEMKIKSITSLTDEVACNVKNNALPTSITLTSEENTITIDGNNRDVSISINNNVYIKKNMEEAIEYIREHINLDQLVYHDDNSLYQEANVEESEEDLVME